MTTRDYQRHARELRELRDLFYRTRLQRGDRLSLAEAAFLFQRKGERFNRACTSEVAAVAEFTKAIRAPQPQMKWTDFPCGGRLIVVEEQPTGT